MSFISISIFNVGNFDILKKLAGSDDVGDDNEDSSVFFDKALIVLFDFPDFSIISAYMLVGVAWAEAYLQVSCCCFNIFFIFSLVTTSLDESTKI